MNQLQAASQSHHGKHYVLSPALQTGKIEAKKQAATKESQTLTHQTTPPKKGIGEKKKQTTQDVKVEAALPQHTRSWMEKKEMLEECGIMAAPATVWQWVNRLWLRGSPQKQEGLKKWQPARKVLWPQDMAKKRHKKNQII